ncbi:hypothetical protein NDU88_000827 [Pleurodeles waltl]|uniref:Uncharacterized protein n=1 Tax=Pleurodeles waltl TaxID=8319 RepID=A0AAV7MIT3_PLEWA|nr:hypothetical protein NDU88_000827 [Pleurodeles waltl]
MVQPGACDGWRGRLQYLWPTSQEQESLAGRLRSNEGNIACAPHTRGAVRKEPQHSRRLFKIRTGYARVPGQVVPPHPASTTAPHKPPAGCGTHSLVEAAVSSLIFLSPGSGLGQSVGGPTRPKTHRGAKTNNAEKKSQRAEPPPGEAAIPNPEAAPRCVEQGGRHPLQPEPGSLGRRRGEAGAARAGCTGRPAPHPSRLGAQIPTGQETRGPSAEPKTLSAAGGGTRQGEPGEGARQRPRGREGEGGEAGEGMWGRRQEAEEEGTPTNGRGEKRQRRGAVERARKRKESCLEEVLYERNTLDANRLQAVV